MTIYSQHPSRGRHQILATYQSVEGGLVSSTVTSVDSPDMASDIADALNRISACLTVPAGLTMPGNGLTFQYPMQDLLTAAADRSRRGDLLIGAHSLWFETVKLLLHEALTDLDQACETAPPPVGLAVQTELATEIDQLRSELGLGTDDLDGEPSRCWRPGLPTILFDGGVSDLRAAVRERMDNDDLELSIEDLEQAVSDMRLVSEIFSRCSEPDVRMEDGRALVAEPSDQPGDGWGHFLSLDTPASPGSGGLGWQISICEWIPDADFSEEEGGSMAGEPIVTCVLTSPPAASEMAGLLDAAAASVNKLIEWSTTRIGEQLTGTSCTVTARHPIRRT